MVKNVAFKEDIIQPFENNKVLLDGICKSEHEKLDSNKIHINFVEEEPICVGIPGGFLGIQAFYGILENILRNTAKHNVEYIKRKINVDNNWKLALNIDCTPSKLSSNLWDISIYDNIEREKKKIEKLINEVLIPYLKNGIIDEKGKLLPEAWGLKEMVICAAYLRGLPLTTIQNPLNNHILEPYIKKENKSKGYYLGFKFRMLKPMVVLIVTQQKIKNSNRETWRSKGIYVENSLPDDVPHPILIIESSLREKYENRIKECPGAYPIKIFYKNDNDIKNFLESNINERIAIYEKEFVEKMCKPYLAICAGSNKEVEFLEKAFLHNKIKPNSRYNNHNFIWDNKFKNANEIKKILGSLLNDAHYLVILEHHQNRMEIINELWQQGHSQQIFYESYPGASPLEQILRSFPNNRYKCQIFFWNLILAGVLKIMILDERVKEAIKDEERKTLEYMKIFVPEQQIDLKSPNQNQIKDYIKKKKPHIVAIHAGILDKMGYKSPEKVKQWVVSQCNNKCNNILRIVIVSGRGRPTNVPDTIPFLSITPIEHYTIYESYRSKFHLAEEILAARRIKHE